MIPVNRPLLSKEDVEAVRGAAEQGWISGEGPYIANLERQLANLLGTAHAAVVSSGTSACDLAVEALSLRAGDEVIAPALTIISTVSAAARAGAKLTLVDSDPDTWCMNSSETVERVSADTKLVIPVHLFGLPVDLDPIIEATSQWNVPVLEDAAEAIGLTYKSRPCGSLGDASIFSFYANKNVTGGEGGAVVTNDPVLDGEIRSLRNLCFQPEERFIHRSLGYNARMSSLVAALISSQLGRISELVARKRRLGARYQEGRRDHPWIQLPVSHMPYAENGYWVFGVVLLDDAPTDAKGLQTSLRELGIDTRRFFCPMNLQPVLRDMQAVSGEPMPVAEKLWARGLYLPSGMGTTDDEIDQTVAALWEIGT